MLKKIFFISLFLCTYLPAQSFFNYELKKISFTGNNAFSPAELKAVILSGETPWWGWRFLHSFTPLGSPPIMFNASNLSVDIISLKEYYRDNGFFNTSVTYQIVPDTASGHVELIYIIDEKAPSTYGLVEYSGLDSIHWRAGFDFFNEVIFDTTSTFNEAEVTKKLFRGIDLLQNNGYLFAQWDSTHVVVDTLVKKVNLKVFITTGNLFTIGKFVIEKEGEGKDKVSDELLTDITGINYGENYNKLKIKKSQDRLARTGLFNTILVEPVITDTVKNEVPLQIKGTIGLMNELSPEFVFDNNQNYFNLGIGANFIRKNFFGRARKLTLQGKVSVLDFINTNISNWFKPPDKRDSTFQGTAEFSATIEQPYVFNRPIFGRLRLYVKSNYGTRETHFTYGGNMGFEFEMPEYTFINMLKPYFSLEQNIGTLNDISFADGSIKRGIYLTITSLTPFIGVELGSSKTDNFFFPSNGYNLGVIFETGLANTRINFGGENLEELADIKLNESALFYSTQVTLSSYLGLDNELTGVLAGKIKTGYIQNFSGGIDYIPANKTFFAGGSNSVRGWRARELYPGEIEFFSLDSTDAVLGGTFLLEGSLELRQKIIGDFGGVAFFDFGNSWIGYKKIQFKDFAVAAGFGFRYYSAIAPFRIDFGFKFYDPTNGRTIFKRAFWETLQFHFGIGEAF